MKLLKSLALLAFASLFTLSINSCKKCSGENPRVQIINNGLKEAGVQVKTSGGNTENLNNIAPGNKSDLRSFAPGQTTFTLVVDKIEYVKTVQMDECVDYVIAIDANNNITSTPTDRN